MKDVDYTSVLHKHENNPESEAHLKANRQKFTGQVAIIVSLLKKGVRLTSRSAMLSYGIGHLARRIKDARDYGGVHIDEVFELDKDGKTTRNKVWFINFKTDEQKNEIAAKSRPIKNNDSQPTLFNTATQ